MKLNIVANVVGQMWRALISVAFVPLYIRHLGIESYGLIGVLTMLLAWLSVIDTGLRATLSREMARFVGGGLDADGIRDALRTIELLVFAFGLVSAAAIWAGAGYLANWVQPEHLSHAAVTTAFAMMGLVVMMTFAEGMYLGSLSGLQRQVFENGLVIAFGTLRAVGALAVIVWISPTIEAFFLWQAFTSLASLLTARVLVYRLLPQGTRAARPSMALMRTVWRFTIGVSLLSLVLLLSAQIDKIVLSRSLSLVDFGYYALAVTAAGIVAMLSRPVTNAFWPRFVQRITERDEAALSDAYHLACQLATALTGTAAALLIAFPDELVTLWTRDAVLAGEVVPALRILALGVFFQSLVALPIQVQMAHAWTSLATGSLLVALCLTAPALLWTVPAYGVIGAAWTSSVLMGGNAVVIVACMHRRLLVGEAGRWLLSDVLTPLSAITAAVLACRLLAPSGTGPLATLVVLGLSGAATLAAAVMAAERLRGPALAMLRATLVSRRPALFGRASRGQAS